MAICKSWLLQFPRLKIVGQIGIARSKRSHGVFAYTAYYRLNCLAMLFSCQRTNRRLFAYQGSQWLVELDRQIIFNSSPCTNAFSRYMGRR